jgi:hypothetical protein
LTVDAADFMFLTGGLNQFIPVESSLLLIQFSLNAPSSAGAKVRLHARLSAVVFRLKHARPGYFVARWMCRRRRRLHDRGLVADPLQHGAASSGSSPWKAAHSRAGPQQIAFAALSTGRSSWAIAVTYPSGVYPSPISSAPPHSRSGGIVEPVRHGGIEHAHRAAGWPRMTAGAVMMSVLPPQNRHRQLDRQCPRCAIFGL